MLQSVLNNIFKVKQPTQRVGQVFGISGNRYTVRDQNGRVFFASSETGYAIDSWVVFQKEPEEDGIILRSTPPVLSSVVFEV